MRCTQYVGLSAQAHNLLDTLGSSHVYTDYVRREHSDGRVENLEPRKVWESNYKPQDSDRICGMFDDVTLIDYHLKDGRVWEEREQETYWSSGPMIYTALWDREKNTWIKESLWTAQQLAEDGVYVDPEDPMYVGQELPKPPSM